MMSLKAKKMQGFARIPQSVLKDGCNHLCMPFTTLMNKIYIPKEIPDKWRINKIITVHKKGKCSISSLYTWRKTFERLILKRIVSMENAQNVNLTGVLSTD